MNISFNFKYLDKYNPVKITLYGLAFWLFLIVFFPLKVKHGFSFMPMLLIVLNYFFFFIGLKSQRTYKPQFTETTINLRVLKTMLKIIIVIALIGLSLKVFDKFVLRDTSFSNTMSQNRISLSKSGSSIISIISAVTNPFCFLPLFIYYFTKSKNKYLLALCIALFFSASLEFVVLGSRSGLFILLILFSMYLFYFKKLKLTFKKVIISGAILFALGIYSINLFIERTNDFKVDDQSSIKHILNVANYNFTIEPTESTKNSIINSDNRTYQAAHLGLINFVQYYVHGMYEFNYMYNNYEGEHHKGAFTFGVLAKFITVVTGANIDLETIQSSPPRSGIFSSFFGPIFMDFGWLSLVFMLIFGAIQKSIYNKVLKGRFQLTPLLFYFLIINFFMPVINFISGAQGLYTITSFVLFALLYSFLTARVVISRNDGKKQYFKVLK